MSRATVYRVLQSGALPVIRDGSRVYILADDLRRWSEDRRERWDGTPWPVTADDLSGQR
ncbi:MAG: helix-turn-helix domain-containing protein [Chloroflexi bacterium]|nr:helix-turn-helix domain-containing protein [Chloroflexota bacterium]